MRSHLDEAHIKSRRLTEPSWEIGWHGSTMRASLRNGELVDRSKERRLLEALNFTRNTGRRTVESTQTMTNGQ